MIQLSLYTLKWMYFPDRWLSEGVVNQDSVIVFYQFCLKKEKKINNEYTMKDTESKLKNHVEVG